MAGYSSAYDMGREVALESLADPGLDGTVDLAGKSGASCILSLATTTACLLPSAAIGTVVYVLNVTGGSVDISDSAGVVEAVGDDEACVFMSKASGADYMWVAQLIATDDS